MSFVSSRTSCYTLAASSGSIATPATTPWVIIMSRTEGRFHKTHVFGQTKMRSPGVDSSAAARPPVTTISPPPPLASTRTAQATQDKAPKRQPPKASRARQGRKDSLTTSTAMPSPTDTQPSSPPPSAPSRRHPHPTRHRPKGKGAAARRKERRAAQPTAMSPVPSPPQSLRPDAQPFVPTVTHVMHWIHHVGGFPWTPWQQDIWPPAHLCSQHGWR